MAHSEDVNNAGFSDLIIQIEDQDGVFQIGDVIATLKGNLLSEFGRTPFEGSDSICIVP